MLGLQELFDKKRKEMFSPNIIFTKFVEDELERVGLLISNTQRADFKEQFKDYSSGLKFDFSIEQIRNAGYKNEEELRPILQGIIDKLPCKTQALIENYDGTIQKLVNKVTDSSVRPILDSFKTKVKDIKKENDKENTAAISQIESLWGKPLSQLSLIITFTEESLAWYMQRTDNLHQESITQDILIRLYGKAIQISKEVLILLTNGYANGAQARWRSLHELSVISSFISKQGDDVAQRYLDHRAINQYKSALQKREYFTRLNSAPVTTKQMTKLKRRYDELLLKYGNSFKGDYGWAANALSLKRPTFKDIEEVVELDHHRPYYKSASSNIHCNTTGVFDGLGLMPGNDSEVLSGASDLDIASPAQSLMISLNVISVSLLTINPTIDSIVICKVLGKYCKETEREFLAVERDIRRLL